jgi:RNA polymerase sigma-70 factor (ECF subfamily)
LQPVEISAATQLLLRASAGDSEALRQFAPLVYGEMLALAERALRGERANHTLSATALANEAYLRLIDQRRVEWRHKGQFLAVAAQAMRRILVDHARARQAAKRGGARQRVEIVDVPAVGTEPDVDLVALDAALLRLANFDSQQSRIVEMRFFGGLPIEEIAVALELSPATVKREWTLAKAWLKREMGGAT